MNAENELPFLQNRGPFRKTLLSCIIAQVDAGERGLRAARPDARPPR